MLRTPSSRIVVWISCSMTGRTSRTMVSHLVQRLAGSESHSRSRERHPALRMPSVKNKVFQSSYEIKLRLEGPTHLSIEERPSQAHAPRPDTKCFNHIASPADAPVHEDSKVLACLLVEQLRMLLSDPDERLERGRGIVQLPSTIACSPSSSVRVSERASQGNLPVIGKDDPVRPVLICEKRVLRRGNTLEKNRDARGERLDPSNVGPCEISCTDRNIASVLFMECIAGSNLKNYHRKAPPRRFSGRDRAWFDHPLACPGRQDRQ